MTPAVTLLGRRTLKIGRVTKRAEDKKLLYTTDDGQLLGLWVAIRLIGEVREIQDPIVHDNVLTEAQILLTAFFVDLKPQLGDQTSAATFRTCLGGREKFDA